MKLKLMMALLMILCLPLFSSCMNTAENSGEPSFRVPQTNEELVIAHPTNSNYLLNKALSIYKETYPDVPVKINQLEWDDVRVVLPAQIMSGKGPDLIFDALVCIEDEDKAMRTNTFADLEPFFKADPDFNREDFYTVYMDRYNVNGRQFIMPLCIETRFLLSTEEILAEASINSDPSQGYLEISHQLSEYVRNGGEKYVFHYTTSGLRYPSNLGFTYLDYDSKTYNFFYPEFKQAAEDYAVLYEQDISPLRNGATNTNDGFLFLKDDKTLFACYHSFSGSVLLTNAGLLSRIGTPVLIPIRGIDGKGCGVVSVDAGINANSPNQQNAYNFLKILFSEEVQNDKAYFLSLPIRKSCLQERYDRAAAEFGSSGKISDAFMEAYKNAIDNVGHVETLASFQDSKIHEYLEPFYKGEKSYETCMKELENYYSIYLSE